MTTTGRRGRFEVDGHAFAGWIPAKELTAHEQEKIERLEDAMNDRSLGFEAHQSLERQRKEIEGDLVPTANAAGRGYRTIGSLRYRAATERVSSTSHTATRPR